MYKYVCEDKFVASLGTTYQSTLALQVPFRGMETQLLYSQTTITFHHQKHPPHKNMETQNLLKNKRSSQKKKVFFLKA